MSWKLIIAAIAVSAATADAMAQTPFNGGGPPPLPAATRPVPDTAVKQAKQQATGDFGSLQRTQIGGQIQEAWDDADASAGIYRTYACGNCTYRVRLREHMVTIIELPEGEKIDRADVGDTGAFKVSLRGDRRLAVQPVGFGTDSNIVVHGGSGALYPFYLRAEAFNSQNVPDLVVKIEGSLGVELAPEPVEEKPSVSPVPTVGGADGGDLSALVPPSPKRPGDFVREVPFDPSKIFGWGDYELSGSENLRPETVYRDDYFTYIRYGDKWKGLELPTAYVVVDGIDELVNSRVQGETLIVESVQPVITLKSGQSYLCIKYEGERS